ncbi:MAG: NAD(P)/FAD-dependent oxidoreductase [Candidatus Kariarchaeaceae archaeon]|jgi:nitrite reductase (NADH) large subunit
MRYIVIGNGIGGITAARELAKKAPPESQIMIFSIEGYGYYPKPKLPNFLGDISIKAENLVVYTNEWYKASNIQFHPNEKIIAINREKREIISEKNEYVYDVLLLAPGANCACPPIPGLDLKNAFTLRSLTDALTIRKSLEQSQSVVIIGGGLLGIENAIACAKRGIKTTIIEFYPQLLPYQLDPEGSEVFTQLIKKYGVDTITNALVKKILGKSKVEGIQLTDGRMITTDLVLTCTGIEPRINLAEKAGLDVNKGIVVNKYLETSDKNIYAVGDAAEHEGRIYGIVPPTTEQARVAARNMINPRSQEYHGSKISTTLKVADLYLTSIEYNKDLNDYKTMKYSTQDPWQYIKLFHKDNQLKSAIILGTKKGIPLIRKLIDQSMVEHHGKLEELFPGITN